MATSGLYFAIYYEVPDNAFYRAAQTWEMEVLGGASQSDAPMMEEGVRTETDFKNAWARIREQARKTGMPVIQGHVFSHASKGDSADGLEFKGSDVDDGTLTQAEIMSLPALPWADDGLLTLAGCNSGLLGTRGWAPARVFAQTQKVTTIGQSGYAYFSTSKDRYVKITPGSQTVYLWAYKRASNGMLGWGGRMPGVSFDPPGS